MSPDDNWQHAFRRVTLIPGGVVRVDLIGGYRTKTILSGPIHACIDARAAYLADYPPEEYRTQQVSFDHGLGNATYTLERRNAHE